MTKSEYNEILTRNILRGRVTDEMVKLGNEIYYIFDTGVSKHLISQVDCADLKNRFSNFKFLNITAEVVYIFDKFTKEERVKLAGKYGNILTNIECRGVVLW